MSTLKIQYNVTRVEKALMQFDSISQFRIFFLNEDVNETIIKFTLRGISAGFIIRTPGDEDLDTLPMYKITCSLFWYSTSTLHVEN